jgi:hypothetical protein
VACERTFVMAFVLDDVLLSSMLLIFSGNMNVGSPLPSLRLGGCNEKSTPNAINELSSCFVGCAYMGPCRNFIAAFCSPV